MASRPLTHPGAQAPGSDRLRLVFWELTARCNLHCRHCRAEAQAEAVAGELDTAELRRVAQNIRAAADPILILTGGEPLARPDFFDIARDCTRQFSRVALATNGTLVDAAMAREIVASGIRRVSISLDGATAETHDQFRGQPGCWAAARRGLEALQRVGASLQVNVTVTRHNQSELPQLLEFALAHGLDAFHVFMLVPVGCGAEIKDEDRLSPEGFETTLRWLAGQALALQGRLQIKATCAPQYHRILRELARETGVAYAGAAGPGGLHAFTRGCLAGSGVCFVSRTGLVQPCGYLPVVVGDLRTQPLAELWRDAEVFAALRDPDRLKGKCGACGYRVACQGCRARAYAVLGDYLEAEPDCPYQPPRGAAEVGVRT